MLRWARDIARAPAPLRAGWPCPRLKLRFHRAVSCPVLGVSTESTRIAACIPWSNTGHQPSVLPKRAIRKAGQDSHQNKKCTSDCHEFSAEGTHLKNDESSLWASSPVPCYSRCPSTAVRSPPFLFLFFFSQPFFASHNGDPAISSNQ